MDVIKLAFYKVQPGDPRGGAIANYGRLFNWGAPPYIHCEIGIQVDGAYKWYSSASKNTNGSTGTRWIDEAVLFQHPERWDVYEIPAARPIADMIKSCNDENGKAYDWLGIMGFVTIFGLLNAKGKWYCSEICYYVLTGTWMRRISPIAFFVRIKKDIIRQPAGPGV